MVVCVVLYCLNNTVFADFRNLLATAHSFFTISISRASDVIRIIVLEHD